MRASNKPVKMILISNSKLFLDGITSLLEENDDIEIVAMGNDRKDIEKILTEENPEFLFIDNRTIPVEIQHLLTLAEEQELDSRYILFRNVEENQIKHPNIIYIRKETDSVKLVEIIKSEKPKIEAKKNKSLDGTIANLTEKESEVVDLISIGFSNKRIAEKLSVSEKTVKAHLTNIFTKLNIDNRYQLMLYGKRKNTEEN